MMTVGFLVLMGKVGRAGIASKIRRISVSHRRKFVVSLRMRILLTADLHLRMDWFAWLAGQKSDLSVVAGDLLDGDCNLMYKPAQIPIICDWCNDFPGNLAICSGNHDMNDDWDDSIFETRSFRALHEDTRKGIYRAAHTKHWMDSLSRPGVITDRRTQLLETAAGKLIVTTIPYSFMPSQDPISGDLWAEGYQLRKRTLAPWLVLHHDPPQQTQVGGVYEGDSGLFYRIQEWKPDYVASGHHHSQPYHGSFIDRLGPSWLFNPGYPDQRISGSYSVPNHIILDLSTRTATWNASFPIGMNSETVPM